MVMGELVVDTQVLVIGSGPGGYGAAFRAADLGLEVTLVDPAPRPGGVCLFQGCIPSKTFLFLSELIDDARRASAMGVSFAEPSIDLARVRAWREQVVDSMAKGLTTLCARRGIELISGKARFESADTVFVEDAAVRRIQFRQAIIATGSHPLALPGVPLVADGRIMDSSGALALADIPERLLVIGGGYIGLELGSLYAGLGSRVRLVELSDRLLGGVDRDLVLPLQRRLEQAFDSIRLQTRVTGLKECADQVEVSLEIDGRTSTESVERVLVAIGRAANSDGLGLDRAGVRVGPGGEIVVDEQQRTNVAQIFAVGDVCGGMMLAHTATRQGKVAAEVIAGQASAFDVRAVPAVVYTDPQVAWCGLSEEQARQNKLPVRVERFPWKYSGRAATMGATDGLTKLLVDPESGRILGLGITGRDAEGLIAEGVLAIEMGALAEDLALSIHPHPTLSETEAEAAELYSGSATHLLAGKGG
ncbi:dihydrolipoyl dehydrogenase [Desulfogranum mediterraneum]|uniref:dihydrolipoyl dehydrogenase n=1 Tax=Desulfogranum mediterraneum TaxID=160661 RepID=UPI0012948014|nr:dihydrolipoyl dehydrogenase [Desulfogranum mediterraneum]